MEVKTINLLVDLKRSDLEQKLKRSDMLDNFNIEDLDKVDSRKNVTISFKEAVDSKFLHETLNSILGSVNTKKFVEE